MNATSRIRSSRGFPFAWREQGFLCEWRGGAAQNTPGVDEVLSRKCIPASLVNSKNINASRYPRWRLHLLLAYLHHLSNYVSP